MNQAKIRIAIADDHAIVRKGLVQIIAELPELEVVAEASNGNDLLKAIHKNEDLDLVIMDIGMPEKSGWETMMQINVEWPHLPVLVLSVFPEEDYAMRFFKAGASGYLNKASAPELLVEAIKKVAHGGRFISPSLAEKFAFEMSGNSQKQLHEALSPREFQVFLLLASGKTVKEASRELALSIPTISTHRARILEKMKMKSNAQLTHYAFKTGLIG
jgi:DNA-binding NarL/FixJ family response regulator